MTELFYGLNKGVSYLCWAFRLFRIPECVATWKTQGVL